MTPLFGMFLDDSSFGWFFGTLGMSLVSALVVLTIVVMWTVFTKAGKEGWVCLIPIYNAWVLCEIGGKPGWWIFLGLIPLVNIVVSVIVHIGVAERFGKSTAFGVGLVFLPFIFYPILAWGEARYRA